MPGTITNKHYGVAILIIRYTFIEIHYITFTLFKDALQELKTAIRASGEHKQRVVIHVAVDGLKIRDEKSGVSYTFLYLANSKKCFMEESIS